MIAKASTTCTCSLDPITLNPRISPKPWLQEIQRACAAPDPFVCRTRDTIKPSVPDSNFETETLYFFHFVKDQYSISLIKSEDRNLSINFALDSSHKTGGGERDRTDDLLLAKQALSQLSYTPDNWWVWMDSNHRPPPYQDGALTN